jgi:hypothetical protein
MSKFTFSDGGDICVYDGGAVKRYKSAYIESYKQNLENINRSKQWKQSGSGAVFRGDELVAENANYNISGVYQTSDENILAYTFTVNQTSGIYKKDITAENSPETHVINSHELTFNGGCYNAGSDTLVTSIKRNYYNADIGVFNVASGDYKTVTDGDTLDEEPSFSPDDENVIYYSSRGVGRNSHGEFICFSPAAIYRLDLNKMDLMEVKSSEKFSYFKPIMHGGKLYAIKAPIKQKSGNAFIDFLLVPWRILQAIAGFLRLFINAFSGKSVTSEGNNPAKGKNYDSKKIEIKGNLIDVEKVQKENAGKKDKDYGYVPSSWQLIEVESGQVIKSGVADYDIDSDGTIIATNGRRIFEIKDGKSSKLCDVEKCFSVNCKHEINHNSNLFDF